MKLNRSEEIIKRDVMEALRGVMVPERNASVYDLELVHEIQIEKDLVRLLFSPHSMLCSSVQVAFDIKHAVRSVNGVRRVEIHVTSVERIVLPPEE